MPYGKSGFLSTSVELERDYRERKLANEAKAEQFYHRARQKGLGQYHKDQLKRSNSGLKTAMQLEKEHKQLSKTRNKAGKAVLGFFLGGRRR